MRRRSGGMEENGFERRSSMIEWGTRGRTITRIYIGGRGRIQNLTECEYNDENEILAQIRKQGNL